MLLATADLTTDTHSYDTLFLLLPIQNATHVFRTAAVAVQVQWCCCLLLFQTPCHSFNCVVIHLSLEMSFIPLWKFLLVKCSLCFDSDRGQQLRMHETWRTDSSKRRKVHSETQISRLILHVVSSSMARLTDQFCFVKCGISKYSPAGLHTSNF